MPLRLWFPIQGESCPILVRLKWMMAVVKKQGRGRAHDYKYEDRRGEMRIIGKIIITTTSELPWSEGWIPKTAREEIGKSRH